MDGGMIEGIVNGMDRKLAASARSDCPTCFYILAVMSIMVVLFWLYCLGSRVQDWLSCADTSFLAVLSWLSFSGRPVIGVLIILAYSVCPVLIRLFYIGYPEFGIFLSTDTFSSTGG
jgi:hypothetical protein